MNIRLLRKKTGPKPGDLATRFWAKVDKTHPSGCWLWTAGFGTHGYGRFVVQSTPKIVDNAHRVAYRLTKGEIPDGLQVLHSCPCGDRRDCVNPDHLRVGDHADNTQDMIERGGWKQPPTLRGEEHSSSKLTETLVRLIRRRFYTDKATCTEIMAEVGRSESTVLAVLTGKTWKHIPLLPGEGDFSGGKFKRTRK